MSAREDLNAINDYVQNRSAPAPGAPPSVVAKWQQLVSQWNTFYNNTISSWYISDSDVAKAKSIRNALMQNQNPDAWEYAQETAADKPGRKIWAHRPDAPAPSTTPWVKKGLMYPGRSPAEVMELQQRINAAGYMPPLKVDGKYGPATRKGEEWLKLRENAGKAASKISYQQASYSKKKKTTSEPKLEPTKVEPVTPKEKDPELIAKRVEVLGMPITGKTILGAIAGATVGSFISPLAAIVGAPVGFLTTASFFPDYQIFNVKK
jgi:hypothetical protein